jgi:hypothetical protein
MDLAYEARIDVRWAAEGELAAAVDEYASRIAGETLATSFERDASATSDHDTEVDGVVLGLSIAPASG